jgi:hypothetical protein
MNDQKNTSGLNSSFYSHFYNEEVYIVKENQQQPKPGTPISAANDNATGPVININGKQDAELLIMFSNPKAQGMNAPDRDFFISILKAAGKKPAEVAALNTTGVQNANWKDIAAVSQSKIIIAFGVDETLLPENIQQGEISTHNGKEILSVEALSSVSADDNKKRILWNGMRKLFNL